MCHESVLAFGPAVIAREHVYGRRVLEVGSYNVNGSLRAFIESLQPASYLGIDIQEGPGVDWIDDAEKPGLLEHLQTRGVGPFDLVICTEMLEHVYDWRTVVNNLKSCVQMFGHLLITTRSFGFPYHAYPDDYWRYELVDMARIFDDFTIITLKADSQVPGVFLYAERPRLYSTVDLSQINVYAMSK